MMQKLVATSSPSGALASEDPYVPIALQYLVSVVHAHHPPSTLKDGGRELRTLADAIDGLLKGKQAQVLDFLMQRFKSQIMAVVEGDGGEQPRRT